MGIDGSEIKRNKDQPDGKKKTPENIFKTIAKVIGGIFFGFIALILIIIVIANIADYLHAPSKSNATTQVSTPQPPTNVISDGSVCFSPLDGAHRGLEKYIKNQMNDPDSYKHVETTHGEKDGNILVVTKFRGKNKFGGVVTSWMMAKTDKTCHILEIVGTGDN
jgi:hypothetical protein